MKTCQHYYSPEDSLLCCVQACMYQIFVLSSLCYLQNRPLGIKLQCWNSTKSYPFEILAEQMLFPAVHIHICLKKSQQSYSINFFFRTDEV